MARKAQEITTSSQVRVGNQMVQVKDLNEEQKERLAIGLQVAYLNELFRGKAEFYPPPGFEVGRNEKGLITVKRVPISPEKA